MTQSHSIFVYSAGYIFFFFLLSIGKVKKGIRLLDEKGPVENRSMLLILHTGGILLLGILPVFFSTHKPLEIIWGNNATYNFQIITISILMVLLVVVSPVLAEKKYKKLTFRGSIHHSLSTSFVLSYFFIRILFICSYEMWFRGYLLTDCINSMGVSSAVLLNIFLYALLHTVNGKEEVLACIPFGLILCSLSIWTGAVWPSVLLHLALTLPYENRLVKKINKPSNSLV
jgi:membrane protease YdiL (CAAX protease family)